MDRSSGRVNIASNGEDGMSHTFSVIGLNHGHINGQVQGLLKTGDWSIKHVYAAEPDLLEAFTTKFTDVTVAESEAQVLEDDSELIASASINADRGPLAVRALEAGKHFFVDKPCVTTLKDLEVIKAAVEATGKKWFAFFGEMVLSAEVEWVREELRKGNLGEPVHFMGLGPHSLRIDSRPDWMFNGRQYGGILNDIASHQMAQFCYWMDQTPIPQFSRVGNLYHPERPEFQDFGDASFGGSKGATGYLRVDWFTPAGLPSWGDIKQQLITTEAYIEHRKNLDIGDAPDYKAKLIVTRSDKETEVVDLRGQKAPFFERLTKDVEDGTETAIPFELGYTASKAIVEVQQQAITLEGIKKP
ncbi:MAG: oxidoreductase [Gemmatimonadetes bacterium]|nr:oxidoreductase [Gemmatimonadota bacterium]